ncbi:MAG: gliding motility-associated C-terminal domain-containing protein [Bacteroidia bacterium]|nr:gliding motility-associated C-terminal domain-containing protein [Bacteroidia bacterium]MDW8134701.1 gliding motility-associated C-terminal domain-containing protein [Bacteroidia bacterium]
MYRGTKILLLTFFTFLWAQREYELFFIQEYKATSSAGPDSLDIYLCIRQKPNPIGSSDTLASSNFPFLYNPLLIEMQNARVIHERKFSSQGNANYYEPILWSISGSRVNVTIRRKTGWSSPGDTIASLDTITAFRAPLLKCGSNYESELIWDSIPAAVLNSLLQDMKPRLDWINSPSLSLCPTMQASPTNFSHNPSVICEGREVTFSFELGSVMGALFPDSLVIFISPTSDPTGSWIIPNGISGNNPYTFSTTFPQEGPHEVSIIGVYRKCPCADTIATYSVMVQEVPPIIPIMGPETVYVGSLHTYTLPIFLSAITWYHLIPGGGQNVVNPPIFFDPSYGAPRVDTLIAVYVITPGSCPQWSAKLVNVLPCPSPGEAVALTPRGCVGYIGILELQNYSVPPDSVRWQKWEPVSQNWVDLSEQEATGVNSTLLLVPLFEAGDQVYRVKVYHKNCINFTSSDTIRVDEVFLERGFYRLTTPICVGDTSWLEAEGRGVWITPDGAGSFTDTLDPRGGYIAHPNDANRTIKICWVIRSADLDVCRDFSLDTICRNLQVNPTDAQGSFSIPPSSKTLCAGAITEPLGGQISVGLVGIWRTDGAGTFSPSAEDPQARYISAQADTGRWIHIEWLVIGLCGKRIYTDSLFVLPGITPQIIGPNRLCSNIALSLEARSNASDSLWWFRGSLQDVLNQGGFSRNNPLFITSDSTYEPGLLPAGQYRFLLYARSQSCEGIDEHEVQVLSAPQAAFDANPRITTMHNPNVTFTSQSQGASIHVWNFGDPNKPSQDSTPNPTFSYSAPGTYTVVLFVQNELGCSDFYVCTECIQVLPRRVYLPNAFSPNGDGKNDTFRILPLEEGLRFTRLEVFDRWGQPVFAADDIEHWNGKAGNGLPLEPGAYSYRAIIFIPDEGIITHTGVVHITR